MSAQLVPWIGLALFPIIAIVMLGTGLPAFVALIGAACIGAIAVVAGGSGALLTALPSRIIALLESDLLQALPLFVAVGALINRLPLAGMLFGGIRAGAVSAGASPDVATRVAALGLGALLSPMNGSVGASVAMLSRGVQPLLRRDGLAPADRTALIAVASTIGVVVPPSLVLIFLGDAMMAAHTVASNLASRHDRIVNTQDIFRAVMIPAALVLAAWLIVLVVTAHDRKEVAVPVAATPMRDRIIAALAASAIIALLGGVASGVFYAVEAAALGCCALILAGFATRTLTGATLGDVLRSVLELSGALFALLVAATTFTLVLRILGTDRLLSEAIAALPGGGAGATAAVLMVIALSAFVLDAFEIVFVIVPIVMPGLLVKAPDAAWVAALTLLTLQASFLLPPIGYALMMARGAAGEPVPLRSVTRAVLPFLFAQILVIVATFAIPALTHALDRPDPVRIAPKPMTEEEGRKQFELSAPPPPELKF